jgi:hypothetical protein
MLGLLSSVVVTARAGDLWFQPAAPPALGSSAKGEAAQAPEPPAAIVLGASLPAPASPSASGRALASPDTQQSPVPIRLPRLSVDVGAGVSMANSDNPPVNLSVNVLGQDPSNPLPVMLNGHLPYGTQVDVRTPEHQLGLHASYILSSDPTVGAPQVSVGASFSVNTYDQTDTAREGVATLRINF